MLRAAFEPQIGLALDEPSVARLAELLAPGETLYVVGETFESPMTILAPDGAERELAVGAILRLDAVRSDARRHVGWLEIAAAEELAQQDVASADEPTAGDDEAPYACTNGYYYYRCTSETCTTCDRHGYKKRKFYCAYGELYPTSTWVCRLPRAGVSRCYYSIGCSG